MTIHLSATFKPHPALASEVVDGELVVLQLDDGIYYGLDAIGTRAWTRLAAGSTVGTVLEELAAHYSSETNDRICADLLALTRELVDARLLVESSAHS